MHLMRMVYLFSILHFGLTAFAVDWVGYQDICNGSTDRASFHDGNQWLGFAVPTTEERASFSSRDPQANGIPNNIAFGDFVVPFGPCNSEFVVPGGDAQVQVLSIEDQIFRFHLDEHLLTSDRTSVVESGGLSLLDGRFQTGRLEVDGTLWSSDGANVDAESLLVNPEGEVNILDGTLTTGHVSPGLSIQGLVNVSGNATHLNAELSINGVGRLRVLEGASVELHSGFNLSGDAALEISDGATIDASRQLWMTGREVIISDGARLTTDVGRSTTGSSGVLHGGTVTVTGRESLWDNLGVLQVGFTDGFNAISGDPELHVEKGGRLTSLSANIGAIADTHGTVRIVGSSSFVDGATRASSWVVEESVFVGGTAEGPGGEGTLNVLRGGEVHAEMIHVYSDGELSGNSEVFSNVTVFGTLSPSFQVSDPVGIVSGSLAINGDLVVAPAGVVRSSIAESGTSITSTLVEVSGDANVGGLVRLAFGDNMLPSIGERIEVVAAGGELHANNVEVQSNLEEDYAFRSYVDDNSLIVRAVATPGLLLGDLNRDLTLNASDIDAIATAIRDSNTSSTMDLDSDGSVGIQDRVYLIEFLLGSSLGNADLNGTVDFSDFLALSANFGKIGGWAEGDFDGNGKIEFPDFLTLSSNFDTTANVAATVPEPQSFFTLALAMLAGMTWRAKYPR